jgi:hypothetical protein
MTSRHLRSDLEGNLDQQIIADDETCVVLSNMARVAAIKSDSRPAHRPKAMLEMRPPTERVSPDYRFTLPACCAHYPGEPNRGSRRLLACSRSLPQLHGGSAFALDLSRPARALIALRPAGSLDRLSAAFVTRLQSNQLPGQTARQLPDQSTIFRMESTSAGKTRLRGARAASP